MSAMPITTAGPGVASKTRRTGSSRPPMPSGWISARGGRGDRGADLQHVRAEDLGLARPEVVGVVLHERGAAAGAGAHRLDGGDQGRGLPVALAAEAVPVGHQPLHGQAGELAQPAEVLEVRGERAGPASVRNCRRPASIRAAYGTSVLFSPSSAENRRCRGTRPISLSISASEPRRPSTRSFTPYVFTETPKRSSASTLSPSVTATSRMLSPKRASRRPRRCCGPWRRGPSRRCGQQHRVGGVPGDGLAGHAEPGLDVPELPVAVCGLVEVHEVHVDGLPRQRHVQLGVQVQQRLAQRVQPADPHLGRRERVHPGDDADAVRVGVRLQHDPPDRAGVGEHRLADDLGAARPRPGIRWISADWSATWSRVSGP